MFDLSKWLVSGILEGFKNGEIPFSKVTELTANYYTHGLIAQKHVEHIATECPAPAIEEVEAESEV